MANTGAIKAQHIVLHALHHPLIYRPEVGPSQNCWYRLLCLVEAGNGYGGGTVNPVRMAQYIKDLVGVDESQCMP